MQRIRMYVHWEDFDVSFICLLVWLTYVCLLEVGAVHQNNIGMIVTALSLYVLIFEVFKMTFQLFNYLWSVIFIQLFLHPWQVWRPLIALAPPPARWPIRRQPGSLRRETSSETGRPSYHTHAASPIPLHRHHHVYTQRQPRKRGLYRGSRSARVPFFPFRHGPRPSVNGQPSAQPRLLFPWCSAVSTGGLPGRLWEPESWWTGAAGQTGGAEQVRSVAVLAVFN